MSKDGGQGEGNDDRDDNERNHSDQLDISEIEMGTELSGRKRTFVDPEKEKTTQLQLQLELEKEKTKREKEKTKQMEIEMKEKTKQMELELKLMEMKEKERKEGIARNSQPIVNNSEEEAFTTMAGSLEAIGDVSASTIANSNRFYYDLFTVPCNEDAYIPNIRLRQLKDKFKTSEGLSFDAYANILKSMTMLKTWEYAAGGSEKMVNDPNLKLFLKCISLSYNQDHIASPVSVKKSQLVFNERFLFASTKSRPEWAVVHDGSGSVLLASKAKGVEASNIAAGMQCFQICADAAIELYRKGLNPEDCVVPGVIICGEVCQIVGVYLVGSTFPVMVNISSLISTAHVEVLSRWVGVLKESISDTVTLLQQSQQRTDSLHVRCQLDKGHFYKPIGKFEGNANLFSNQRIILSKMMMIYEKLCRIEGSVDVIQFPLGLVSVPGELNTKALEIKRAVLHCIKKFFEKSVGDNYYDNNPCLIFSFLEGWHNNRPDDDHREAYIEQLRKVVNILNLAGVVHMDLRPANIMWQPTNNHVGDENVQIQVIDFEDALVVGSAVDVDIAEAYRDDVRYPIRRDIDCKAIKAKVEYNNFFLDAIEAWLSTPDVKEFSTFMIMSQETITYYD